MYKKIISAVVVALAVAAVAAPNKIGVVDMEKLFREYYKTKITEAYLRQQGEVFRTYAVNLSDTIRKLEAEFRTARDSAQNLAISEADRQKHARNAEAKSQEIRVRRGELEQYARDKQQEMRRIEEVKRGEIMKEISNEIARKAAAEGFQFIFDRTGRTTHNVPVLVYYGGGNDLTDAVLRELNRGQNLPPPKKK